MRYLLAVLPLLVACNPSYQRQAKFDDGEYASFDRPGAGSLVGQAFLKTRGGDVKYGAANTVILNPVTSYSREWFEQHVLAGKNMSAPDERTGKYQRTTIADGQGGFAFEGLPAGDYYAVCHITWQYATGYGSNTAGGWAFAQVTVKEGQQTRAVVTR